MRVRRHLVAAIAAIPLLLVSLSTAFAVPAEAGSGEQALTAAQRHDLRAIAARTWRFYSAAVDPTTSLPADYVSDVAGPPPGTYASPTDIGVYLWSIVAARDLHLIDGREAAARAGATLTAIERLRKWEGFLLSWYDTTTAGPITGPGGSPIPDSASLDGQFISNVDNAWYASALVIVRQAFPSLWGRATKLLDAMNFGTFYDAGDQSASITAGQQYGGFIVGQGPATFHYGVLNTETRIGAYIGIGTHTMPGDVWWRTWRTLPAEQTYQTQVPQGYLVTISDPQSGKRFTVFEGHYSYGGIQYAPSWGGSEFEGLMDNLIIPETAWGPHGFGANDRDYALTEVAYVSQVLHYPVWGLSPASTPDDTGNYLAYGVNPLSSNAGCCPYDLGAVTPHASFIALPVLPQQAYRNITTLRLRFPGVYGRYGFYDSVNPTTGQMTHRYLDLDQSMVMAALDEVLNGGGLQRYYTADAVGKQARPYLAIERMSVTQPDE